MLSDTLKGSPDINLFFPSQNNWSIQAFSDFDWAHCLDNRYFITGYCILLWDDLVFWKSKKQKTLNPLVKLSTEH